MPRMSQGKSASGSIGEASESRVSSNPYLIDCLQFCQWSDEVFRQMREGRVDAIHATVVYHGTSIEAARGIEAWNELFTVHDDLICRGLSPGDIAEARRLGRTAIFLGFQNPSPLGDDLGLVEVFHSLGIRFMQLSYNNQSLLAAGWMETDDTGITRMGREVIREMNRLGMVIDMSHSGSRSTLEAIEFSSLPVAVTHANPDWWCRTPRNKSDDVIKALAETGGMIGFSLYPNHLHNGSDCTIDDFCSMVSETAERHGADCLGLGSDLCQDRPASALAWMRNGRWTRLDGRPGSGQAEFPSQPSWFRDNRDFSNIAQGLRAHGFSQGEIAGIMGGNWFRYLQGVMNDPNGDA